MSKETIEFLEKAAWFFGKYGILPAFISGLVAWSMQSSFFNKQNKLYKERAKETDEKKIIFMLKAFLQESRYNLKMTNVDISQTMSYKILFDTHCYSLFKTEIGMLDEEIVLKINELYLKLFENNVKIDVSFRGGYETPTSMVVKRYQELKQPLNQFIEYVHTKIDTQRQ